MSHHAIFPSTPQQASGRTAALWLLSGPLLVALLAFVIAVIVTLLGEMEKGSVRFYLAALSYSSLTACVVALPAYLVSYCWYGWWTTGSVSRIATGLWLAPLIAAATAWFPATLFPSLTKQAASANALQIYLVVAGLTLILGYAWSFVVWIILRLWRKL